MSFLNNYEDVNARIKRFRHEFPAARLIATIEDMNLAEGWILFKAEIYREYEDHVPSATGYAYGHVGTYPANMKKWFVEDTETSAYGRAIAALIPTDTRATKQDMERVEYSKPAIPSDDLWATLTVKQTETETGTQHVGNVLTLVQERVLDEPPHPTPTPQPPHCRHGEMLFKSGTSQKTGNPYTGYTCKSTDRSDQCKPVWL
jgi:hypothetical protein